jgi:Fasciclin domain
VWRDVRSVVAVAAVAALLVAGCGGASDQGGGRCATDDGTGENPSLVTVSPSEAKRLTVADVLRRDERFSQFRKLAAETDTQVAISWLEIWDQPTDRPGNRMWLTVFVPPDTAFAALDPEIRTAFERGRLDNLVRYTWLGHHTVHRPYPSRMFTEGPQGNWQPTGLGTWENTTGPSGPVDVELTLDPLTYGGCPILQTDLRTVNGYVHVIGGVVLTDDLRKLTRRKD